MILSRRIKVGGMKIQIYIEKMTCNNCSKVLRHTLEPIPGVVSVVIRKKMKIIILQIDENQIALNQIVNAINEKGFAAEIQHIAKKQNENEIQ